MYRTSSHWLRLFRVLFFIFIVGNLLFLDYWVLTTKRQYTFSQIKTIASLSHSVGTTTSSTLDKTSLEQMCDEACVKEIYANLEDATRSAGIDDASYCDAICIRKLNDKIDENADAVAALQNKTTSQTAGQTSVSSIKEIYIPLGFGSSAAGDWTDVPGLQATIDTNNYSKIQSVVFEATMRIPTGNEIAYARLYNVTDSHPVWFSDVQLEGGTPQLLISSPITLDTGKKTYRVQMKTSLRYDAFIDQARLHLTLQ